MYLSAADIAEIEEVVYSCLNLSRGTIEVSSDSSYTIVNSISVTVIDNSIYNVIARFSLTELPGCCGVIVSHGTNINELYRGKGLGAKLAKIKQKLSKDWGYTVMICTDIAYNVPQRRILESNGWETAASFVNMRTDNDINIDVKHLYGDSIIKKIKRARSKTYHPFKYMIHVLKKATNKIKQNRGKNYDIEHLINKLAASCDRKKHTRSGK